jgi:hypothetical protein
VYEAFFPRFRSLEDTSGSYPVFIQKRRDRYGTVRQFKRAGLLGEGLDGRLRFVEREGDGEKAGYEKQLMQELIISENLDRESTITFIMHNCRFCTRDDLVSSFRRARRRMALTGDPFETADGWEKKQRGTE